VTNKDYIVIAKVIRAMPKERGEIHPTLALLVERLSREFVLHNTRFNREKFHWACGDDHVVWSLNSNELEGNVS
jgi:hypothetical protein